MSTSSPSPLLLTSIPSLTDTISLYFLGHTYLAYCLRTLIGCARVQGSLSQLREVRTICRFSKHPSSKAKHELIHSLFNDMAEGETKLNTIKQTYVAKLMTVPQAKADKLLDSTEVTPRAHSGMVGCEVSACPPPNQTGQQQDEHSRRL